MIAILTLLLSYGKEGFILPGKCPMAQTITRAPIDGAFYAVPSGNKFAVD
jgi:hypothetical protein